MKIKICGLRRKEDIDYVNLWRPDFVGFVFAGKKRKIDYDTAKMLKKRLDKEIKAVGVFVNEDITNIDRFVSDGTIDMVQLHGDEDMSYIQALRKRLGKHGKIHIPIIKAVRVKSTEQVLEAQELPVDYLLLDAFTQDEYGGSGKMFNHDLIPCLEKTFILAGGIDCENVMEIIEIILSSSLYPSTSTELLTSTQNGSITFFLFKFSIISMVQAL